MPNQPVQNSSPLALPANGEGFFAPDPPPGVMTPKLLIQTAIIPALAMLPSKMTSHSAITQMTAIAIQESGLRHRRQIGGPARGWWQFERDGGVAGVLYHPVTKVLVQSICYQRNVPAETGPVYAAIEHDDILAAAFARLLMWQDSAPHPEADDAQALWDFYLRTWRPGKPRPEHWAANHAKALAAANSIAALAGTKTQDAPTWTN